MCWCRIFPTKSNAKRCASLIVCSSAVRIHSMFLAASVSLAVKIEVSESWNWKKNDSRSNQNFILQFQLVQLPYKTDQGLIIPKKSAQKITALTQPTSGSLVLASQDRHLTALLVSGPMVVAITVRPISYPAEQVLLLARECESSGSNSSLSWFANSVTFTDSKRSQPVPVDGRAPQLDPGAVGDDTRLPRSIAARGKVDAPFHRQQLYRGRACRTPVAVAVRH